MSPTSSPRANNAPLGTGLLLVLAFLAATGPFTTDLYLPSFPEIARELGASASGVQLTLTAFLIGMAAGQLAFGPLSDRYGRFRPLLLGSGAFVLASVVCAIAPNLEVLIAARFVQGLCAAAGPVIARAVASDLTSGAAAARTFSLLMTIGGVAPVLAPVLGGILTGVWGWRGVLWTLAGIAALMFACAAAVVRETLPVGKRSQGPAFAGLGRVLRQGRFAGYVLLFASSFGVLMGYISASPFVYQSLMGLSPEVYGLMFGLNAAGMVGAGFIAARLARRVPARRMVVWAVAVLTGAAAAMLILVLTGVPPLLLVIPLFCAVCSLGFIMGNTTALALAEAAGATGSGSAVLGGAQFLMGAAVSPLTGLAGENSALPLALVMLGSALLAGAAVALTRGRHPA
ncbi:multidrug effflux MFS transporter [Arthrobacter sp. Sa2CUA1]|uniref:Multidrug effflux MFS transporter n=1 Tax=Arthrobacter gallicola TaxID=2762225 RepID=A0ABR8UQ44_9MICC|nr:multidrug effflux MFS transporter [Arthrobacter gallicola]MBD7994679.1 multidrug effflux MFS transporter [Arthrobacter gallicola]